VRIASFPAGSVDLFNAAAISCSPEIACGVLRSPDGPAITGANAANPRRAALFGDLDGWARDDDPARSMISEPGGLWV